MGVQEVSGFQVTAAVVMDDVWQGASTTPVAISFFPSNFRDRNFIPGYQKFLDLQSDFRRHADPVWHGLGWFIIPESRAAKLSGRDPATDYRPTPCQGYIKNGSEQYHVRKVCIQDCLGSRDLALEEDMTIEVFDPNGFFACSFSYKDLVSGKACKDTDVIDGRGIWAVKIKRSEHPWVHYSKFSRRDPQGIQGPYSGEFVANTQGENEGYTHFQLAGTLWFDDSVPSDPPSDVPGGTTEPPKDTPPDPPKEPPHPPAEKECPWWDPSCWDLKCTLLGALLAVAIAAYIIAVAYCAPPLFTWPPPTGAAQLLAWLGEVGWKLVGLALLVTYPVVCKSCNGARAVLLGAGVAFATLIALWIAGTLPPCATAGASALAGFTVTGVALLALCLSGFDED